MLTNHEKMYETLENALKPLYGYVDIHAIYEPADDTRAQGEMYQAAGDLCEPGVTYLIDFVDCGADGVVLGKIERWFMG